MIQQQFNIDGAALRYEKAKEDGSKGGRKVKGTPEEVYIYYKVEGHKLKETAEYFKCSERTVQDKCKKYLDMKKSIENAEVAIPEQVSGTWRF